MLIQAENLFTTGQVIDSSIMDSNAEIDVQLFIDLFSEVHEFKQPTEELDEGVDERAALQLDAALMLVYLQPIAQAPKQMISIDCIDNVEQMNNVTEPTNPVVFEEPEANNPLETRLTVLRDEMGIYAPSLKNESQDLEYPRLDQNPNTPKAEDVFFDLIPAYEITGQVKIQQKNPTEPTQTPSLNVVMQNETKAFPNNINTTKRNDKSLNMEGTQTITSLSKIEYTMNGPEFTTVIAPSTIQVDENIPTLNQPVTWAAKESTPFYNMTIESKSVENVSQTAILNVNHVELGDITAKIKVDQHQSEITLLTETNEAKQALQSQLLQLKDSFANSDLVLTQADIQQHLPNDKKKSFVKTPPKEKLGEVIIKKLDTDYCNPRSRSLLDAYV